MARDLRPIFSSLNHAPPEPQGIFGAPQQGKTTLAAQIFAAVPTTAIFVNYQQEPIITRVANRHCTGFDSVWSALRSWTSPTPPRIEWIPSSAGNFAVDIYRGVRLLHTARRRHPEDRRRIVLFFDEMHKYAEKDSPIEDLFRQGARFGLQSVCITQFPASIGNRNILGSLGGGISFLFLDSSQWATITAYYKWRPPPWVHAYTAHRSYRGVFTDHAAWYELDGPAAGGDGDRPGRQALPTGVEPGGAAGRPAAGGGEVRPAQRSDVDAGVGGADPRHPAEDRQGPRQV